MWTCSIFEIEGADSKYGTFIITKLHGRKTHYPIRQGRQKQISCGKAINFAKVHLEKNESYGKNKESENDRQVGASCRSEHVTKKFISS